MMATEMQRLIGASQEDFDEEDMETDVKDEADGEEDEDGEKSADANSMMVGVDGGMGTSSSNNNHLFQQQDQEVGTPGGGGGGGGGGARRCRPLEEKERTKLRERQRRAITAKILAGLRRHGNYNLRVRADINDVIAALAREAGWVVLPDGTAYPANSQGLRPGVSSVPVTSSSSQMVSQPHISLEGVASGNQNSTEQNAGNIKNAFMPGSSPCDVSSINPEDGENQSKSHPHIGVSIDKVGEMQIVGIPQKFAERDFSNTAYVPVYVMLPLGVINMKCELVDPDGLSKQLRILKSVNVDGVMVDCWWGIVEGHAPLEYKWFGYRRLFEMVRDLKLKLQVVMSFHECGGNLDDDVCITLPHWVAEIGRSNPNIYFTDRAGRRNPECLSWGIDKERVLRGRTALEVYFDCMRSFRVEFEEFFQDGIISMIQVGLGPCGELRFPSCTIKHGWRYPGIGEFQCYDLYLLKSLRKAAEVRGHSFWGRGPDNAGSYNSRPHESGFFCDGGDYDGYYGRFFLDWYSRVLVDHGDRVLSLAKLAFDGTCIAAKLSCIHWWYKTPSHAAELTAGFYNPCNRDGYAAIVAMLKKHGASLHLVCTQFQMLDQQINIQESMGDPQGLFWQVLNAAWDVCIPVSSENAVLCHDRVGYNKILDNSKPLTDPDGRHLSSFTYLRLSSPLMESHNLVEFDRFAKKMHGEAVHDDSHPFMYSK